MPGHHRLLLVRGRRQRRLDEPAELEQHDVPCAGTNVNDWANFNAGGTRAPISITNIPARLGGLNISDGNITISLSGDLTVKGGGTGNGDGQFNMSAGSVVPSGSAVNLILDDVGGADSHGGGPGLINGTGANVPVIGGPSYNNALVLQDGTSMKMTGNVDVYSDINVSVGDSSGKTDTLNLQGGTLTLMQNSPNNTTRADPNSNNITVGTGGVLKFDGANGEQTVAATTDASGLTGNSIHISGGVMTVQARGTASSTTTTVPITADGTSGLLDVESHNNLLINAAGTELAFALEVGGTNTAQIGLQNPGDTGPGNAGIACCQGAAQIDAGGLLLILGPSDTFSTPGSGSNGLTVLGQLTLGLPGDGKTWTPSNLTITSGDITFGASSTFSFWGRWDNSDFDKLTVTSGNVWIDNGASLAVNVWGTSTKLASWGGVIKDTAGGGKGIFGLNGATGFNDPAGWTSSYPGGPPSDRMDVVAKT